LGPGGGVSRTLAGLELGKVVTRLLEKGEPDRILLRGGIRGWGVILGQEKRVTSYYLLD